MNNEGPICSPLIACDALVGAPRKPLPDFTPDVADLEAEMGRLAIDVSVVRHRACLDISCYFGNRVLMEEIGGRPHLIPAWFLTSDGCEPSFDPEVVLDEMLAAGVRLAWTDPDAEMFSLRPWCSEKLLGALEERRVPLLVSAKNVLPDLHEMLNAFPKLRVILLDVPRLGRNRMIEPLIEQHSELYLCFGPSFSVHTGFRDLCSRYGPYRWVWGAGYPSFEGGAAITGLTYSGLTGEEMGAIAHGNIERLLSEVLL